MRKIDGNGQRRSPRRRVGFPLAETIAAVSQMALLCPRDMDAWMRQELTGDDGSRRRPARRR